MSEVQWFQGLQRFLYDKILPLAEPDASLRLKLVEQPAMLIWMKSFTHESFNPNVGENYEDLEKLGDAIMKAIFTRYLMLRFEQIKINPAQLSELSNYYLSKPQQASIAVKLGLDQWVRTPIDKNTHIFEDLLEALFGSLLTIGDMVFKVGSGYVLCFNLLVNIYNDIDIDLSTVTKGHPKTQVKQLFDSLGWGTTKKRVIEDWKKSEDGTGGIMTLRFPRNALIDLRNRQMILPSDVIASAEGSTKKVASDAAYVAALNRLTSMGITQEWVKQQRLNEFTKSDLAPYYPDALARLRSEGFISMYFRSPRIGTKGCYVQLIGEYPNHQLAVLVTVAECTEAVGKREALRRYALRQ